jgi:hypothetical protein
MATAVFVDPCLSKDIASIFTPDCHRTQHAGHSQDDDNPASSLAKLQTKFQQGIASECKSRLSSSISPTAAKSMLRRSQVCFTGKPFENDVRVECQESPNCAQRTIRQAEIYLKHALFFVATTHADQRKVGFHVHIQTERMVLLLPCLNLAAF